MSDEFHLVASTEQRDETRDLFYAQIGSRRNISAVDEHLRERYSRYFEDYTRRTAKRGRYRVELSTPNLFQRGAFFIMCRLSGQLTFPLLTPERANRASRSDQARILNPTRLERSLHHVTTLGFCSYGGHFIRHANRTLA
jgi:hypothetical protein